MNQPPYHRPQDDVPYERRMLIVIRSHKKLQEENEQLKLKVKSLEKRLDSEKTKQQIRGAKNKIAMERNTYRARKIKRLKARIEWLTERLSKYEKLEPYEMDDPEIDNFNADDED